MLVVICCGAGVYLVTRSPSGPTRSCVYTAQGISGLRSFARLVHRRALDCAEVFNMTAPTWQAWAHPYFVDSGTPDQNWSAWARAVPGRRLIITQPLIPTGLAGGEWLGPGSRGAYAGYAVALARDLVGAGLGHAVIRLAPEANGTWETYSLPSDATGLAQWRELWRRTVEAMRSVPGASFTFDWNVNALVRPVALGSFYPGNDVVDVIGIDAYDPVTLRGGWGSLADGPDGVRAVARFARQHGKPLSVPEWGAISGSATVGMQYLEGLARVLRHARTSYQSYFFAHQWESALTGSASLRALYEKDFSRR